MKVLRQPKWTPEAGLKPEKGSFLQQKMFFFTTSRTPLLQVVQAAGLEPGLPGAAASLARIVVKKHILCCKKNIFPASDLPQESIQAV